MDEILEILRKTASRTQKLFDESKDPSFKRIENSDKTLKSEKSSEAQKVQASLLKTLEYDRLERLSSQLSLLYILQMFAFKVKILQISVTNLRYNCRSLSCSRRPRKSKTRKTTLKNSRFC